MAGTSAAQIPVDFGQRVRAWHHCARSSEGPQHERHRHHILLAERPHGRPTAANFRIETVPAPIPADGQVLLRVLFLLLDPYMRGRMDDVQSHALPMPVNALMEGGTVAEVVESRHPDHAPGDKVLSHSGWQTHALSDGTDLRRLDPAAAPLPTALGMLGFARLGHRAPDFPAQLATACPDGVDVYFENVGGAV